jgi:hypothetical protein
MFVIMIIELWRQINLNFYFVHFIGTKFVVNMDSTNNNNIEIDELKFKIPSAIMIGGPSSSGKTHLCQKIVDNRAEIFTPAPRSILYCYGQYNGLIAHFESIGVKCHQGPPSDSVLQQMEKPGLVILDDLLYDVDGRWLATLFTRRSHHENFSIIMLVQNLFDSKIKVPRINSQYIILMRAPNSLLSIRNLGTQLYPRKIGFFLDAYKKATAGQYGYLLIDMHPASRSYIRLRTCIFPGEATNIFIPKSGGLCRILMYFAVFYLDV